MAQSFLDNSTGLPTLWAKIKEYVNNNRFDATRLDIDIQTGHLIVTETGNLSFSLDENGHLISEVK
ncbi:hypothetical protein [Lacrimispora sp.]|uniref:hypothetical protein n=1 Tax=Lacrimispora sp. TaxID=2719234 RepID=UPI0034614003